VSPSLLALAPRARDGTVRVVIESPAGSRVKLKYAPELGGFVLSRPLVLGVSYPFDWGFVPGTRASDGDPVDAMVLLDVPTYPGVIVPCRPLALLEVEQDAKESGRRERNDRIIVEPLVARRPIGRLSKRLKQELEEFFVSVTLFEGKNLEILGWEGPEAADALIDRSRRSR
jgi:inorganic pyrophosphatase